MSQRITALFIALSLPFLTVAQEGFITGKVSDSGESLGGVSIYLDGKSAAMSRIDGRFTVVAKAGEHLVEFRFVGYEDLSISVKVSEGDTAYINPVLQPNASELGTVVISAGKFEQKLEEVTVSMEVLSPEFVNDRNTTNMENLMQQVPGVTMLDGQANIRGGSGFSYGAGSRVMILVDGLPMLTADAGDTKWNFIPVENIEQVEVIKGASSALFGSSAMNGVIHFRTSYPRDTARTTGSFSTGIYNNPARDSLKWWKDRNRNISNASVMHSRQIGRFDVIVGGSTFADQGYRKDETEDRGRVNFGTRYRFKNAEGLSAGINGSFMDVQGGLFLLWKNADSAWWPSGDSGSIFHSKRFNLDPFVTYIAKNESKHSLRTRYFRALNQNNTNQESLSDVYYADYQFQMKKAKDLTLTQGVSSNYGEVVSDSLYGNHYTTNLSAYFQADKKWNKWVFSLGFRTEYYKVDTAETKFKLFRNSKSSLPVYPVFRSGVNYKAAKHSYLRASFGQGYRFPSVAEKFISTQTGGLTIYPNPELQPETGWSTEIGFKQALGFGSWKGYADLAGFWQEYNNMMEFTFGYWVPPGTPNPPPVLTMFKYFGAKSINTGRTKIGGAEISITAAGNIGKMKINILAGYTYTHPVYANFNPDSTDGSYNGNILKYRYEHLTKIDLGAEWRQISFGISVRHNSFMKNIDESFQREIFSDIDTSIHTHTYILPGLKEYREEHNRGDVIADTRLAWKFHKSLKISFLANNTFNREYMGRPGDIQPPRTFVLRLEAKF